VSETIRRLRWNPTVCTGAGYCAEVLPELIALDDWGFPILDSKPLDERTLPHAERAVAGCPRLALLIEEVPAPLPKRP